MSFLLITVRWLDDRYHGKLNREGPAEWPPSPHRLFQALVAGVARQGKLDGDLEQGLAWLQGLEPPMILAPSSRPGTVLTRFVPNNDGDKKPNRQDRLAGKLLCPTLMSGDPEIHYIWKVNDSDVAMAQRVGEAARLLTCLGWGVDMAHADGQIIDESKTSSLAGVRWRPCAGVKRDEGMLRTPIGTANGRGQCTLTDLRHAHASSIARIEHGKPLNTVDKPKVFGSFFYESKERLLGRPNVIFELRNDDGKFSRYSQRKLIHIAGMVRCLAIKAMDAKQGSPPTDIANAAEWVDTYVAGHAKSGDAKHRQFSYIPLPSIGMKHTDPSIRRVMIAAPLGDDRLLEHLALRLAGQQLKPKRGDEFGDQTVPPTLERVRRDNVARFYTAPANVWASVTPVILPGHNDHKPAKTIKLIEKALRQSGIEQPCTFEWRAASWWPQSLSAHKYDRNRKPTGYIRPDHLLTQTAVHLKLRFDNALESPGPLVIGAGRHCGFGLMAGFDEPV